MELDEAIRRRRMCRDFSPRPLPAATVDRLVDRARRAPSAGDTQGWAWVVLEGAETGRFWSLTTEAEWLADPDPAGVVRAPVVVLPLVSPAAYLARYSEPDKVRARPVSPKAGRDRIEGWPVPYWLVDGGMALQLLLLGAVAEGVGALLFALHRDPAELLAELGVPAGWEPLGAVALGWPAGAEGKDQGQPSARMAPAGVVPAGEAGVVPAGEAAAGDGVAPAGEAAAGDGAAPAMAAAAAARRRRKGIEEVLHRGRW
ncbi:MAG: nitroreductase family protein [Acidimicrobiales bacterium]